MKYDLIIIGAGSAGIPCAIRAAERGLKVLVIEKAAEIGGTLHITAGHMSAAGTNLQKQAGINDTAQQHWADIERISHKTADDVIAKKAVELAPSTIDWLEQLGYKFHEKAPLIIYGHEAYSKPRTYFGADDYFGGPIMQPGKAVLKTLLPVFNKFIELGHIELLLNHSLNKINKDNNRIKNIEVKHNNIVKIYAANNYVLASGGYASNKAFFEKHHNMRLVSTANENSTGDGIKLATDVGAIFTNAEKHMSTLGGVELEPGSGRASFWQAWARVSNSHDRTPREIYINENGERFMNEHDLTVDERERMVLQQPNQRFYVVFDEASLLAGPAVVVQWNVEKFKEEAAKEKCCWQANTIKELAKKINVPIENLQTTITNYNGFVANKFGDQFNRTVLEYAVTSPPYYALLVYAYSLISFGGIKVNEQLQVQCNDGTTINNLYAAGEILGAGATSGNAFCGGMLLTPAISFGKWLGENC